MKINNFINISRFMALLVLGASLAGCTEVMGMEGSGQKSGQKKRQISSEEAGEITPNTTNNRYGNNLDYTTNNTSLSPQPIRLPCVNVAPHPENPFDRVLNNSVGLLMTGALGFGLGVAFCKTDANAYPILKTGFWWGWDKFRQNQPVGVAILLGTGLITAITYKLTENYLNNSYNSYITKTHSPSKQYTLFQKWAGWLSNLPLIYPNKKKKKS